MPSSPEEPPASPAVPAATPGVPEVSPAAPPGRRGLVDQLVRFVAVGVVGAAVDLSVYTLALHLGAWTPLARTLSFICGTVTAYVLNRRWTFQVEGGARRAAGFAVLYATTFVVIIAVNAAALALLPDGSWRVTVAWAISQGFGTLCNFVMLRLVVFRS